MAGRTNRDRSSSPTLAERRTERTDRLVRAMGGRVWARPRAAGGAEFGFALHVMADG